MLKAKTVFVLGAGASCDYGLPTGQTLLEEIKRQCTRVERGDFDGIVSSGFDTRASRPLHQLLDRTTFRSIDAMLSVHPEHTDIGKYMIALCLLPFEKSGGFFDVSRQDKNWMLYLFEKMRAPTIAEFAKNPTTFVTFNYDRCLEWYLRAYLMDQYRVTEQAADEAVSKMRIIHVHGQLGSLAEIEFGGIIRHFNGGLIRKASQGIKIIHEAVQGSREFELAASAIVAAERVAFLGFGYHETNIERLQLARCGLDDKLGNKRVYGTTLYLSPPEVQYAISLMKVGQFSWFRDNDCSTFLKHSELLF